MVRYSKNYGRAFWGSIESLLVFAFELGESVAGSIKRSDLYCQYKELCGDNLTSKQIANQFYELKRRNYIEIESEGEVSIKLTNKAKIKIIDKIIEGKVKDDKYRFISFDIPERLHYNRDMFRRAIKRMGFRQIQQSLWVIDKNISDLVEIAAKEYGVEEYVAYIVAEKSNIDAHIEQTLKNL